MGLSRNKVAVPEGAAGTPPFWSVGSHWGLELFLGSDEKNNEDKDRQGFVRVPPLGFLYYANSV